MLRTRAFHPRPLSSTIFLRRIHTFATHVDETALEAPLASLHCGALLQTLTNSRSDRKGRQLHAHMVASGVLLDNTYLATKLSAFYAICGDMAEARALFDRIVLKNSFLWNVMIRGYARGGSPLDSLVLYREMLGFGKRADNFTYPFVLMACGDLLLVEIGGRVHCEIIVCGYESDVYVGNSLLSMYSKFGEMELAWKLFDRMSARDLTSWNTMISGYARNGDPGRALSVFALMGEAGVRLDCASLLGVMPACTDLSALRQGKQIHGYVVRNHIEFDGLVTNALISIYSNSNFMIGARSLFENIGRRDIVSWNSIISGYAWHGDAVESLRLFRQLNSESLMADQVTLIAVLRACDQIAALHVGRSLHAYLAKKGFDEGVIVGTALITTYAKCGSLGCSRQVFDEMPEKNLVSWSAMVSGYGLHGRGKEAITVFNNMKANAVIPDKVTFTSILSACSHAGLVDEGRDIFTQMPNEFSVEPAIEHYSCMVDLLGRAGHLDEAYEFIKKMEVEPNVDVWAALLSACQVHRNVELAEIAAQNAFNLNPKDISLYVSLSNIYAREKRWDDVERVRAIVRRNGLKKTPGCSFVELDQTIHRFLVGDKSHPQSKYIYAKLEDLRLQLKEAGYIPDTSSMFYEVEEDVKEEMLWDHSEIVVRDSHRFHHFHNGSRSCSDYW